MSYLEVGLDLCLKLFGSHHEDGSRLDHHKGAILKIDGERLSSGKVLSLDHDEPIRSRSGRRTQEDLALLKWPFFKAEESSGWINSDVAYYWKVHR
jgi:hypothetical protein